MGMKFYWGAGKNEAALVTRHTTFMEKINNEDWQQRQYHTPQIVERRIASWYGFSIGNSGNALFVGLILFKKPSKTYEK